MSFVLTCSHLFEGVPCCTCIVLGMLKAGCVTRRSRRALPRSQSRCRNRFASGSTRVRAMSGCTRCFVKEENPNLEQGSSHTVCACASRMSRLGIESDGLSRVSSPQGCRFYHRRIGLIHGTGSIRKEGGGLMRFASRRLFW